MGKGLNTCQLCPTQCPILACQEDWDNVKWDADRNKISVPPICLDKVSATTAAQDAGIDYSYYC